MFCLVVFPCLASASEKHQTTLSADTTRTRPIPYPTSTYAVWLNAKFIDGYQQIFMQYHNPADATGDLVETQLTTSKYDKSNPQWGPGSVSMHASNGAGNGINCTGQAFLFTGDDDGSGVNHLYIDCLKRFPASPVAVFESTLGYSLQLTDVSGTTDYDVADYDIDIQHTFAYRYLRVFYNYYEVVFTTAISGSGGGELHHLLFRPEDMDASGIDYHIDANSGLIWHWLTWVPTFTQYRTPRFFNSGKNIIFSASHSSLDGWELGGMRSSGLGEVEITNISRDVVEPKVFNSTVVFGLASDGISPDQLAYTTLSLSISTINDWCSDVELLTSADVNRIDHDLNLSTTSSVLEVAFARERQDNGFHDIYYAEKTPACLATNTTTITTIHNDLFDLETQLTCSADDIYPLFMPAMNSDATHTAKSTDPVDMMLQENAISGLDIALVHLHNNPVVATCVDTCSSNANGDLIDDPDSDSLRNDLLDGVTVCDNCPDVYNPDQTDSDLDGLGDACDVVETTTTTTTTTVVAPATSTPETVAPQTITTETIPLETTSSEISADTFTTNPSFSSDPNSVEWGSIFQGDKANGCSLNRGDAGSPIGASPLSMLVIYGMNGVFLFVVRRRLV